MSPFSDIDKSFDNGSNAKSQKLEFQESDLILELKKLGDVTNSDFTDETISKGGLNSKNILETYLGSKDSGLNSKNLPETYLRSKGSGPIISSDKSSHT